MVTTDHLNRGTLFTGKDWIDHTGEHTFPHSMSCWKRLAFLSFKRCCTALKSQVEDEPGSSQESQYKSNGLGWSTWVPHVWPWENTDTLDLALRHLISMSLTIRGLSGEGVLGVQLNWVPLGKTTRGKGVKKISDQAYYNTSLCHLGIAFFLSQHLPTIWQDEHGTNLLSCLKAVAWTYFLCMALGNALKNSY